MDFGLDLEQLVIDPEVFASAAAGTILRVGKTFITKPPGRPPGDPAALTAAANCWRAVASRLHDVTTGARRQVNSLDGEWRVRARAEFVERWTELAAGADEAADELDRLGEDLTAAAAKLADAQNIYDVAFDTAVVSNVVGLALSWVTLGASEAAAAGEAVASLAAAAGLGELAVALIGTIIENAVVIAEQIALRFAVQFGVNIAGQAVFGAIIYPDHNPVSHLNIGAAAGDALAEAAPSARVLPIDNPLVGYAVHDAVKFGLKAAGKEIGADNVDPAKIVLFLGVDAAKDAILRKIDGG